MNKGSKISDQQFLSVLRENAGLFAQTARAINKQFGVKFTRQSVRERAMKFAEELQDIEEENLDIAEEGLHSLMNSDSENIKLRAIELFLKTKGKRRGYIESQNLDHTTAGQPMKLPIISFEWPEDNE